MEVKSIIFVVVFLYALRLLIKELDDDYTFNIKKINRIIKNREKYYYNKKSKCYLWYDDLVKEET